MTNYWGFRIDLNHTGTLWKELDQHQRLRQGWGYDDSHDLRKCTTTDPRVRKNFGIFNNVKKDDILLVPRLPTWDQVAVVIATTDFNEGYEFEPLSETGDHGHIFPAKFIKSFRRSAPAVAGDITMTLRYKGRFWNISRYAADIERIRAADQAELGAYQTPVARLRGVVDSRIQDAVRRESIQEISAAAHREFEGKGWEHALQVILNEIHPEWNVELVGGRNEVYHGTDLLVTIPSVSGAEAAYGIAIQVKDQTVLRDAAIDQIRRVDTGHWEEVRPGLKVIDKYVIVTKAEVNSDQIPEDVKVIDSRDLDGMIERYVRLRISKQYRTTSALD